MRISKLIYPYSCHECGDKGLGYNSKRIFCTDYCKKQYYYHNIKSYRDKFLATKRKRCHAKSMLRKGIDD